MHNGKRNSKLKVEAIRKGTVIDHIPEHVGFRLLSLFRLIEKSQRITIGFNLPSCKLKRKDLIKMENTFLTKEQVNQIAFINVTSWSKDSQRSGDSTS